MVRVPPVDVSNSGNINGIVIIIPDINGITVDVEGSSIFYSSVGSNIKRTSIDIGITCLNRWHHWLDLPILMASLWISVVVASLT